MPRIFKEEKLNVIEYGENCSQGISLSAMKQRIAQWSLMRFFSKLRK